MSVVWDKDHHIIGVKGTTVTLKKSDVSLSETKEDAEMSLKTTIDNVIAIKGYHLFIHIFEKPTNLSPLANFLYSLWLGSNSIEPNKNWWEDSKLDKPIIEII